MSRPYRIIIWGPGDMGGRALRTALTSPQFEIVSVKVFSLHKNGVDNDVLDRLASGKEAPVVFSRQIQTRGRPRRSSLALAIH